MCLSVLSTLPLVNHCHLCTGTLQTAKAQGQLTLEKVLEMKEQGVEIDGFVSEDMRVQLYSAEVVGVDA